MVLNQDGTVWTAGDNEYGQLGDRSSTSQTAFYLVTSDEMLSSTGGAKAIAAGYQHSMVLGRDGSLWATGRNDCGQLGDGSKVSKHTFLRVTSDVQVVAAGVLHSMILKVDGTFWATGSNNEGQLGDGSTSEKITFVKLVQTSDDEDEDEYKDKGKKNGT